MNSVSVIIPTWNRATTIQKAIRSALDQTLPPLEVLVCDDGSNDETKKIVAAIDDPRVRWLPGPHGGRPAIPRNRGIWASKGEWLAFLDSDDEWLPEKLERQFLLLERLGCKAACTNAHRIIPQRGIVGPSSLWPEERKSLGNMLWINRVVCSSALIHRSLFDIVGTFPEDTEMTAIEDYAFWLRVATQTDFAYVHEPVMFYYDNLDDSVRTQVTQDEIKQRRLVYNNFISWLCANQGMGGISTGLITRIERRCKIILLWLHVQKWAVRMKATLKNLRRQSTRSKSTD